jgi:hypothetical protein
VRQPFKALVRINPGVKVIAASGLNTHAGLLRDPGSKVKHFLTKPYTAETLLVMIHTVLNEPS